MEQAGTDSSQRLGILNLRFSDVLLTLLIPAALYALVFTYQEGYFAYFFLPSEFIQLDWTSALSAMVNLVWVFLGNAFLWFLAITSFTVLLNVTDNELYKLRFLLFFVLTNEFLAIPNVSVNGFMAWNTFWVVVIAALLFWWRGKKVAHKIGAPDYSNIFDAAAFVLGKRYYVLAFALATSLFFVYNAGWQNAAGQSTFLVTASIPREVVLATSGNLFISAPYAQMHTAMCRGATPCFAYRPEYAFQKIPDQGQLRFYRKNLGPLSVVRVSTPAEHGFWAWFSSWYLRQRK